MKEHVIEWEWEDHAKAGRITAKWIMQLIVWSIVIAYLPNIILYFAGYPANALLMRCIIAAIGLPIVLLISMALYRMQYEDRPLKGRIRIDDGHIMAEKVIMSNSYREYATIWKSVPAITEKMDFDRDGGFLSIRALFHVEAYKNRKHSLITASEFIEEELKIPVPDDKSQELADFLGTYYKDKEGDRTNGKKI